MNYTISVGYDPVGNPTSYTDGLGHVTTDSYDERNRRVSETLNIKLGFTRSRRTMSHSGSLNLMLGPHERSASQIIDALLMHGWSFEYDGSIMFIPAGDHDMFSWELSSVHEWARIRGLIEIKELEKEIIGISLVFQDSHIGGDFLIYPGGREIAISWTINRKRLKNCERFTDHSWYLSRVLPPLIDQGFFIESAACHDVDA